MGLIIWKPGEKEIKSEIVLRFYLCIMKTVLKNPVLKYMAKVSVMKESLSICIWPYMFRFLSGKDNLVCIMQVTQPHLNMSTVSPLSMKWSLGFIMSFISPHFLRLNTSNSSMLLLLLPNRVCLFDTRVSSFAYCQSGSPECCAACRKVCDSLTLHPGSPPGAHTGRFKPQANLSSCSASLTTKPGSVGNIIRRQEINTVGLNN